MAKKWDGDATASEKLLSLYTTLLFNKRAFSLTELSSEAYLNASKPTVTRLLARLENSGVGELIREQRGRESYFRLARGPVPDTSLNADGLALLALCRDLVLGLLPANIQTETGNILARLGARNEPGLAPQAASLAKGRIDYAPYQEIFATLEKAVRQKSVCRISYLAAANAKPKEYPFAPMRLLCSQEAIYFEGWALEEENLTKRKYDDPLRLALHRFQSCEICEISSENLPAPPPIKNEALGLMEYDSFTAKIRFAPEAAAYVSERIWSKDQTLAREEDGSVVLTARMANFPEALAWVLGFGKRAAVLEPEWFVKKVRGELRETLRNYGKKRVAEEEPGERGDAVD